MLSQNSILFEMRQICNLYSRNTVHIFVNYFLFATHLISVRDVQGGVIKFSPPLLHIYIVEGEKILLPHPGANYLLII